jgi:hypothetical protein
VSREFRAGWARLLIPLRDRTCRVFDYVSIIIIMGVYAYRPPESRPSSPPFFDRAIWLACATRPTPPLFSALVLGTTPIPTGRRYRSEGDHLSPENLSRARGHASRGRVATYTPSARSTAHEHASAPLRAGNCAPSRAGRQCGGGVPFLDGGSRSSCGRRRRSGDGGMVRKESDPRSRIPSLPTFPPPEAAVRLSLLLHGRCRARPRRRQQTVLRCRR